MLARRLHGTRAAVSEIVQMPYAAVSAQAAAEVETLCERKLVRVGSSTTKADALNNQTPSVEEQRTDEVRGESKKCHLSHGSNRAGPETSREVGVARLDSHSYTCIQYTQPGRLDRFVHLQARECPRYLVG